MIEATDIESASDEIARTESSRGIARAAGILALGNVISRMLGLAREVVKSNLFGASDLLGAYTVAALVPLTLFNLITGGEMVSSSLVPVFSDYAAKERRGELWGVVSTFLSLATAVLLLIVLFVEAFTPQVAWLAGARNFEDTSLIPVTVELMRLATPGVLFLSVASILTGVLYALKRFALPAFTAAAFNGTIVVVALLRPDRIHSLAWGLLLGSFLQIVMQLPALRDGRFRPQFNWKHPAVRRILILYAPIVAGLVVNQAAIWISYNLAITTGDNSVAYMNYATTLYQFPLGLVVTALSIATLPTLSQLATAHREASESGDKMAASQLHQFKETLADGLRLNMTLILPAAAGLFALAGPIVAMLFQHGQFTPADTEITARVLRYYLFGLPFAAIDQMLVFASYARKDTWRPAVAGVISIAIYTITAVALLKPLGLLSLMVADAVKHFVHTLIMLWLLQRHLNGLAGYGVTGAGLKSLSAAVITGIVAYAAAQFTLHLLPENGFIYKLILVVIGGGGGLLAYAGMVYWLNIPEAKLVPQLLFRRGQKT
ncbi:MAG: murein biosynthesis integral membrane protein MurJ [Chloroflexi bacterium]|nr:murein biosynthesis integral membrane protein MurJ [Chloroflexota bacterium]